MVRLTRDLETRAYLDRWRAQRKATAKSSVASTVTVSGNLESEFNGCVILPGVLYAYVGSDAGE